MRIQKEIAARMRDGIILYSNLYLPEEGDSFPVLICRLPYDKNLRFGKPHDVLSPEPYVQAGFAVLMQDQRGTGSSEGLLTATGNNEFADGYDTIEWAAKQNWCNGHVGMIGCSNHGFAQLAAAATQPSHLMSIAPWECQSWAPFNMNCGGTITVVNKLNWVYNQSKRQLENMKLSEEEQEKIQAELDQYRDILPAQLRYKPLYRTPAANVEGFPLVHEYVDTVCLAADYAYWQSIGRPMDYTKLDLPMYHLTGWGDFLKDSTIENYTEARTSGGTERMRTSQYLTIGPWNHGSTMAERIGDFEFGEENRGENLGIPEKLASFHMHFMEGTPLDPYFDDPVHYYVMQEGRWHSACCWPDPAAKIREFRLSSCGHANTLHGDGRLTAASTQEPAAAESSAAASSEPQPSAWGRPDHYVHDPDDPVPTKPGAFRLKRLEDAPEFMDFTEIEERQDVLVYTSEALEQELTAAGEVTAELYAATTAEDTDFMCRLLDVFPDGKVYNVTEGAVRARFRNTYNPKAVRRERAVREELIRPGEVVCYQVNLGNCAWQYQKGHRIRLEIAGSSFPRHDINPGVAAPLGYAEIQVKAEQTVYHDARYPSRLLLPILTEG